jgi:hypothetical protein
MKRILAYALGLFSGLIGTGAAHAQSLAPSFSFIGSGCPKDADSVDYHWEGSTLVIQFAELAVAKGPGQSPLANRKNCSLTMDLKVPKGLTYALVGYRAVGHDTLSSGDSRNLSVSNFFQGSAAQSSFSSDATGPKDADFSVSGTLAEKDLLWSPCNVQRAHTITTAVRVNGNDRQAPAAVSIDSLRLRVRLGLCQAKQQDRANGDGASDVGSSVQLVPIVD